MAHCMVGGGALDVLGNLRKGACPEKICHGRLTLGSEKNDEFRGDLQKKKKKRS